MFWFPSFINYFICFPLFTAPLAPYVEERTDISTSTSSAVIQLWPVQQINGPVRYDQSLVLPFYEISVGDLIIMLKWEPPPSKYRFYFLLRKWIYLGSTYNKSWPAVNKISVLLTKHQDPQKLGVFRFEVFCTKEAKFPVRSWTDFANFIDNLLSTVPKKLYKLCKKHIYYGPEKKLCKLY